jgi:hypothetical protein
MRIRPSVPVRLVLFHGRAAVFGPAALPGYRRVHEALHILPGHGGHRESTAYTAMIGRK